MKLWSVCWVALSLAALSFASLHLFPAGWDLLYAARADRYLASGVVTRTTGDARVAPGDPCEILVDPDFKAGYNCRVDVVCGGRPLWGGALRGGYSQCVTADHRFVSGKHEDSGDPHVWLAFDIAAASLTLDDTVGIVELRLQ